MKRLLLLLTIFATGAVLLLGSQEREKDKEERPMFMPRPLDDQWSRWIVGEWEGAGESDAGKGKIHMTAEMGLNGQFLIMKGEAVITELAREYLKKTMKATDEELKQFQDTTFRSIQFSTIEPETKEVTGYLFDSLRCIATGRGKREGNKEIMEWQWSGNGQGTSIRITEKVSEDKIICIEKYALPDGSKMEDRGEMTRCKRTINRGEQK